MGVGSGSFLRKGRNYFATFQLRRRVDLHPSRIKRRATRHRGPLDFRSARQGKARVRYCIFTILSSKIFTKTFKYF